MSDFAYARATLPKSLEVPLSDSSHTLVDGRADTRHTAANIATADAR